MVNIINSWWLVADFATGSLGTAKSQTNSHLGSSRLPELNILADTEPPSAIPASGSIPELTSSTSSSSQSSSPRTSTRRSSASGSQPMGSNEAGYAGSFITNPVIIKGNRFFDSVTGDYFAIRGVNYYPRPNTGPLDKNNLDLFSNEFKHIWQRDVPQFAALEANVIRLYAVDPEVDHTDFMCTLQSAGIYVIVDLGANCEGCEITADSAPACYPASYKTRGERIIEQFARFDNVLAFSGGNEINHRTGGNPWTWNAPCQKKFIRDMRAFIQSCPNLRQVPVGLVVADTSRDDNAQYYNCRTDESDELENAQWYGINTYVHCDDISDPTKATGFNMLRDSFKSYDYSIPVVLTEFGCVSPAFPTVDGYEAQRTFHDAVFMNLPEYSDYFAGGVAFEYSTENANSMSTSAYPFNTFGPQNYGLGYFMPEECTDAGINCTFQRFPNFENLKEAYTSYDSSSEPTLSSYKIPSNHDESSACPKGSPILSNFTWEGDSSRNLACPSKAESRYQCPNLPWHRWHRSWHRA
ncbi:glycoside hydrolase, putative [Phytophthora infestans T30-4]|uniref:Glycoside hydrolase, putative n=1 Tax=Phytophthora infestans (strain T30-4) TaxID=403677 RepID=D0NWF1_PHYIT|nr:glycoside hydrolase, putative [Phytophthora infestans T30-4]EEY67007.1 glycoside hydrolase, putative [Phytophthora infestans T30-4]|eukprot:XP_002896561.1 glycoside hydrolase, putative [Phytophthora infestans T30-4]